MGKGVEAWMSRCVEEAKDTKGRRVKEVGGSRLI